MGAQSTGALEYSDAPRPTAAQFFAAPPSDGYYHDIRILPRGSSYLRYLGGDGYFELEAITYPAVNRLDSSLDERNQLAYAQAAWTIAHFHARRTQARLRREVGFAQLFRPAALVERPARMQSIMSEMEVRWEADVNALVREVQSSEPLLRAQAFANEFAAAADTIAMPSVGYSPHGVWVYVGFGPSVLIDGGGATAERPSGAGAIDLGLGYRYRRWRFGYAMRFEFAKQGDRDVTGVELEGGNGTWENFGVQLGYDLWSGARFATTAHAHVGGGGFHTGTGDDRERLASGVTPGLSFDLRVRLGAERDVEYYGGLKPRHPITLFGRIAAMSQTYYTGERITSVSLAVGVYLDAAGLRYGQ